MGIRLTNRPQPTPNRLRGPIDLTDPTDPVPFYRTGVRGRLICDLTYGNRPRPIQEGYPRRYHSGAVYSVRHLPGQWSCSCTAAPYARCSHLRAVQLITAPAGPVVLAPDLMVGGAA